MGGVCWKLLYLCSKTAKLGASSDILNSDDKVTMDGMRRMELSLRETRSMSPLMQSYKRVERLKWNAQLFAGQNRLR